MIFFLDGQLAVTLAYPPWLKDERGGAR